jgi:hypothetical protein
VRIEDLIETARQKALALEPLLSAGSLSVKFLQRSAEVLHG